MSPPGRVVTPENPNQFYFGGLFFRADMGNGGFLAILVPYYPLQLRFVGENCCFCISPPVRGRILPRTGRTG